MATEAHIYERIGGGYNTTRVADPYIASRLFALLHPREGGQYLDIGCGTGNYTCALAAMGLAMTGVEPAPNMLAIARSRSADIQWQAGMAEEIPFTDATFDGALGTLTLHHWRDLPAGMRELARVLRPGAKLVFFTTAREQVRQYWLNHYFPDMLARATEQMPDVAQVTEALLAAGFDRIHQEPYDIQPDLRDHFLYVGKAAPEKYLDPVVRRGISSFTTLAHADEVAQGLAQLEADIASGRWQEIAARYQHDGGDYLFLQAERK